MNAEARKYAPARLSRKSSPAQELLAIQEQLMACPDCGQPGFTARGLSAHRGSKHCRRRVQELGEVVTVGAITGEIITPARKERGA